MATERGRSGSSGTKSSLSETNVKNQEAQNAFYRYHSLSKPKINRYSHTKWLRDGRIAKWGTQDMLTPPTNGALRAVASARIEDLAKPKVDKIEKPSRPLYLYSCGRVSQISLVPRGAQTAYSTPRVEQLAKHKEELKEFLEQHIKEQYTYSCGRSSPIWQVDARAATADERQRIKTLARHKDYHVEYLPERPLPWKVSPVSLSATCSERMQSLAQAKSRIEDQFRDPQWEVAPNTQKATPTPRVGELARHKPMYEGYAFNYDPGLGSEKLPTLIRDVTRSARNAVASSRTKELATPIIRQSMDLVQFDPEAFVIKPNVLNAHCSGRIAELATPTVR